MIFQVPIDLEIKNRMAQAVIDLDTGFIGFTETINESRFEYYFGESPIEFKKALLKRLEPLFADNITTNWKISRKNEKMKFIRMHLIEKR